MRPPTGKWSEWGTTMAIPINDVMLQNTSDALVERLGETNGNFVRFEPRINPGTSCHVQDR